MMLQIPWTEASINLRRLRLPLKCLQILTVGPTPDTVGRKKHGLFDVFRKEISQKSKTFSHNI